MIEMKICGFSSNFLGVDIAFSCVSVRVWVFVEWVCIVVCADMHVWEYDGCWYLHVILGGVEWVKGERVRVRRRVLCVLCAVQDLPASVAFWLPVCSCVPGLLRCLCSS